MVWNLIKLKRETGSIKPKAATGGKTSQLEGKEAELAQMVRQYSDYTLEEYCEYWEEQTGVRVSASTMCRKLQKQDGSIKKRCDPAEVSSARERVMRSESFRAPRQNATE